MSFSLNFFSSPFKKIKAMIDEGIEIFEDAFKKDFDDIAFEPKVNESDSDSDMAEMFDY